MSIPVWFPWNHPKSNLNRRCCYQRRKATRTWTQRRNVRTNIIIVQRMSEQKGSKYMQKYYPLYNQYNPNRRRLGTNYRDKRLFLDRSEITYIFYFSSSILRVTKRGRENKIRPCNIPFFKIQNGTWSFRHGFWFLEYS